MSSVVAVEVDQVGPSTSEGRARTHTALIDRPQAKGGQDRGAMGGEYILIGLGGCFMSNILAAIKARDAQIANVRIKVEGTLEQSPQRFSAIHMSVSADCDDVAILQKLITISERACIAANTLRNGVDLSVHIK